MMTSRLVSTRTPLRATFVGALIAATALLTFGGIPAAAQAATVSNFADLQAAISTGGDTQITLAGNIEAFGQDLLVNRDVELDTAGFVLRPSSIHIAAGSTLTLSASVGMFAFNIAVDGTLQLASDLTLLGNTTINVGTAGKITSPGTSFSISGAQLIANQGTITATLAAGQQITGNDFTLYFRGNDPAGQQQDIRVFAPTLDAAGISFPPFSRTHASISGWNTEADGAGQEFTSTTPLVGVGLVFAQWAPVGITDIEVTYTGRPDSVPAGWNTVQAIDTSPGGGGADMSDLVDFSSSNPDDELVGSGFSHDLVTESAGSRVVTAVLRADPSITSEVTMLVTHTDYVDEMSLTMSPSTVALGGASQAVVDAVDQYGNSFGDNLLTANCDSCQSTLTSSVPGDVIDQATGLITFSSVGSRTITLVVLQVESDELIATAVVNVTPAVVPTQPKPPTLVATGSVPTPALTLALLAVTCGLGALLVARRRAA